MSFKKLTIANVNMFGKRVLMRVDFNVPILDGKVYNPHRIIAVLDSIKYVLYIKRARSVVLIAHLGHPRGRPDLTYSLAPVAEELRILLQRDVIFLPTCIGPDVQETCADPTPGTVFLLENLKFHIEEEGIGLDNLGQPVVAIEEEVVEFRQSLKMLADIYVNDAFGTAHRAYSSMVGENFEIRVAGFLVRKEIAYFSKLRDHPEKPCLLILGGSKLVGKIQFISNLLDKVTDVIICGLICYTFLKIMHNMKIGNSWYDPTATAAVHKLIHKAAKNKVNIFLPVDFIAATELSEDAAPWEVSLEDGIPDGMMGFDIGPNSIDHFRELIVNSKMIMMNGAAGMFEYGAFAEGTKGIMAALIEATSRGATTLISGGDTAAFANNSEMGGLVSHISTGGGSSLAFLEGKALPGIAALSDE